jgi:hypothetical protein
MAGDKLSSRIAHRMKWYVYAYVDPTNDEIFYVGKGRRRRVLHGLKAAGKSPLAARIRALRETNAQPRIEILAHSMTSEEMALRVEAAVIDTLKPKANRVRGWHAVEFGRAPLHEVVALYDRRPVKIKESAVLIRINKLYRPLMSQAELYDATRGIWRVDRKRASRAKLAFAVFEGVVREVYVVKDWFDAGSTFLTRHPQGDPNPDRKEFIGRVAPDKIRQRYINRDVSHYFQRGSQNPVRYVNV